MAELRRHFEVPGEDRGFLEARGLAWEAVKEGNTHWLVLHEYPIPAGYAPSGVSLALQIPFSYPSTQIDMAYFHPALAREDGVAIGRLTGQTFDGRQWQRWSRHRTGANPWRPDVDCIETHLLLVDEWLEREFRRERV